MNKSIVSKSFETFAKEFKVDLHMKKAEKRQTNGFHQKADLSFVYKKGSSTCIKISKDIAEQIGIIDYIGISYFDDDRIFIISSTFSNTGTLYPVCYNKSDKKYRCYRTELFKTLVEKVGITFDNCTCVSYKNTKIEDHPTLGKIAIIHVEES